MFKFRNSGFRFSFRSGFGVRFGRLYPVVEAREGVRLNSATMDPLKIIGPAVVVALAVFAIVTSGAAKSHAHILPRFVDAVLVGISVFVRVCLVDGLEYLLSIRLFHSKMMGSVVTFCTNPRPPLPHAFAACSVCAFLAGCAFHATGMPQYGVYSDGVLTGIHVVLSKLSVNSFSATVGLAASVGKAQ